MFALDGLGTKSMFERLYVYMIMMNETCHFGHYAGGLSKSRCYISS